MSLRLKLVAPLLGVLALVAGACGEGFDRASGGSGETVTVTISDEGGFQPAQLSFPVGTTVKFLFKNEGKELHEAVFGDQHFQDDHEKEMKEQTSAHDQHMPHSESEDFIEIKPGKSEEFTYTFDEKGTFFIACHVQPGHYARGEQITVEVT